MENRYLKYVETVIIEECKLLQSLEYDFDSPETPDYSEIEPFLKNLALRGENAIEDLRKYLLEVACLAVPDPVFDPEAHQDEEFFDGYYTKLSLLTIAYETLANAMTDKSPRLTEIATNNVESLTMFLSQLERLYNGYQRIVSLKDIRARLGNVKSGGN